MVRFLLIATVFIFISSKATAQVFKYYPGELTSVYMLWWSNLGCSDDLIDISYYEPSGNPVFSLVNFDLKNGWLIWGENDDISTKQFIHVSSSPWSYLVGRPPMNLPDCQGLGETIETNVHLPGFDYYSYYTESCSGCQSSGRQIGTYKESIVKVTGLSRYLLKEGDALILHNQKVFQDEGGEPYLEVEIALSYEEERTEWAKVGLEIHSGNQLTVSFNDIDEAMRLKYGNEEWLGKECKIRLRQTMNRFDLDDSKDYYYYTNSLSFKYLEPLELEMQAGYPHIPSCIGSDDAEIKFNITNLPSNDEVSCVLNITKYSYDTTGCQLTDNPLIINTGKHCPVDDPWRTNTSFSPSSELLINKALISQMGRGEGYLTKGYFKIEVTCKTKSGNVQLFTSEDTVKIDDPDQFTANFAYVNSYPSGGAAHATACDNSGTINYSLSYGTSPFKLKKNDNTEIDFGATTSGSFNLPVNYTGSLTVVDSKNCLASLTGITADINFKPLSPILISNTDTATVQIKCKGAATGEIHFKVSGGNPPYSYKLNDNAVSVVEENGYKKIKNLTAGTYKITVTDGTDCPGEFAGIIIKDPAKFTATASYALAYEGYNMKSCDTGGKLNFNINNGKAPYLLSILQNGWSGVISELDMTKTPVSKSEFPEGEYQLLITDGNGCSDSSNIVFHKPSLSIATVTVQTPTCNSSNGIKGANGSLFYTINSSASYNNYTVSLRGSNQSPVGNSFTGLQAGNYTIVLKETGCSDKESSKSISNPALFTATIQNGLTIDGYNFGVCQTSATLSCNLTNGSYPKILKDNNGNIIVNNLALYGSYPLDFNQYNNHSINIVDGNGCQALINNTDTVYRVSFTKANKVYIDSSVIKGSFRCNVGNYASAKGIISYSVAGVNNTPINVNIQSENGDYEADNYDGDNNVKFRRGLFELPGSGNYQVTVSDAFGCTWKDTTISVIEPALLTANISVADSIQCNGGSTSLTVNANGGTLNYQYSLDSVNWVPVGTTSSASYSFTQVAGIYKAYVKDANGCTASSNPREITESDLPISIVFSNNNNSTCGGKNGSITIDASGGTSFTGGEYYMTISKGVETVVSSALRNFPYTNAMLGPGDYLVTITDQRGCDKTETFKISDTGLTVTASYSFPASNYNMKSCDETGTLIFTFKDGDPNYTIKRADKDSVIAVAHANSDTISGFPKGEYKLTVIDSKGCVASVNTGNTIVFHKPSLSLTANGNAPDCNIATPNASGASSYTNGSISYVVNHSTDYNNYSVAIKQGNTILATDPAGGILSGLGNNVYTVVLSEQGCNVQTRTDTLNRPPVSAWIPNLADSIPCTGGATLLNVQASGGLGSPYQYSLDNTNWQGSSDFSISKGIYTAYVKDGKGCKTVSLPRKVTEADQPLSISARPFSTSCDSAENGSVTIKISGGTPDYRVIIKKGSTGIVNTSIDIDSLEHYGLAPGTYSVQVTDLRGCLVSKIFEIQAKTFEITIDSYINTLCNSRNTGQITFGLINGNANYNFWLSKKKTDNTYQKVDSIKGATEAMPFSNLYAGEYKIMASDNKGCTAVQPVDVGVIKLPVVLNAVENAKALCDKSPTGSISVNRTNGSAGTYDYFYLIDNKVVKTNSKSENTFLETGLKNGEYIVRVSDVDECVDSTSVTIGIAGQLSLNNNVTIDSAACEMSPTGKIEVPALNVAGNVTYQLFENGTGAFLKSSTSGKFTGIVPGGYKVKALYGEVCESAELTQLIVKESKRNPISISISDEVKQSCSMVQNGKFSVTASSGYNSEIYTITKIKAALGVGWKDSVQNFNSATFNNLKAGLYQVKVDDDKNCSRSLVFKLDSLKNYPYSRIKVIGSTACKSARNGAINFSPLQVQSKSPYTYFMKVNNSFLTINVENSGDFHDLENKNYEFRVKDAEGCYTDTSLIVPATHLPVKLSIPVLPTPASCLSASNGTVTLSAAHGFPGLDGYKFVIKGTADTLQGTSKVFTMAANSYWGKVYDKYYCSDSASFTINVLPPDQQLSLINKGETQASGPGAVDGKVSIERKNGTPAFVYTVVNTANGVTERTTGQSGTSLLFDNFKAGEYRVKVNDGVNCTANADFTIIEPGDFYIYEPDSVRIAEYGKAQGIVRAKVKGGSSQYLYRWYAVNGTTETELENGTTGIITDYVQLQKTNLSKGRYKLKVKDVNLFNGNGIWKEKSFTIVEPSEALGLNVIRNQAVRCKGESNGTFEVAGKGGWGNYTYSFNNSYYRAQGDTAGLPTGTYTVYVKDMDGVIYSQPVVVLEPAFSLKASVFAKTDAKCYGSANGSVQLSMENGQAPYSLALSAQSNLWVPGTSYAGLANGSYTIHVKDHIGCTASANVTIGQPQVISVSDYTITESRCKGANGEILVNIAGGTTGTGNYSYLWYSNQTSFVTDNHPKNLKAGAYSVDVSDDNTCVKTFSFDVPDISDLTVNSVSTVPVLCYGAADGEASIVVSKGNPPYTITWPNGVTGTKITGLRSGTNYLVSVRDRLGCDTSVRFNISSPQPIGLRITSSRPECTGVDNGELTIEPVGGTPGYSYNWSNGKSSDNIKRLSAGAYSVTVTDSHDCTNTLLYNLVYEKSIKPALGKDVTICSGNEYVLRAGKFATYDWSSDVGFTSADSVVRLTTPGNYYAKVTDSDGCIGFDTLNLAVSAVTLSAEFLVASKVMQGDTVVIIESSWPKPDSLQWTLPPSWKQVAVGDYFRQVVVSDTGTYNLSLKAFRNDCFDIVAKTVTVGPWVEQGPGLKSAKTDMILKYILYPNPTSGNFTTEIKLREKAACVLKLVSLSQGRIIDFRQVTGGDSYLETYSMPKLPVGVYALYLQVGNETKTLTIIKQ